MERIRALINKLQQQSEQKANASEMLGTVNLLQLELSAMVSSPAHKSSSKVSVVLPSVQNFPTLPAVAEQVKAAPRESEVRTTTPAYGNEKQATESTGWLFEPVEEIPTLAHQKEIKELNDVIGRNTASLNDKLKTEKTELVATLKEGPVRDLKKAIGVNDRFVFLKELFRDDEAMYERSIKTINNFRIYPEAEYWIERELKVKLGWDESKETVKYFCQLVKRRFS